MRGRAANGPNSKGDVEKPMLINGIEQQTPKFDEESIGCYNDEESRSGKWGRKHQRLDDEKYR